jgi:predicted nucleotidyltransferase component of viral defense system
MLQTTTVEPGTLELLKILSTKKYLTDFFLVGGTALALQLGHRNSIDLDFFTVKDFDSEILLTELLKDFEIVVMQQTPQAIIANINGIKVDFIRFRYKIIDPLIETDGIRMLSMKDISAMKLDAINGRGSKKDFYDLYFLLQYFDLETMLNFYHEKYPHQTSFQVVRSISYFIDAENQPNPLVFDKKITWNKVKKTIQQEIKKL